MKSGWVTVALACCFLVGAGEPAGETKCWGWRGDGTGKAQEAAGQETRRPSLLYL